MSANNNQNNGNGNGNGNENNNQRGPPDHANAPDHAGPPEQVKRKKRAQEDLEERVSQEVLGDKARTHLAEAREAEKQADPSKMSPEDRAIYHYMQAITTVLEQDYDILLDS